MLCPLYNKGYWRGCGSVYTLSIPYLETTKYCFYKKEMGDIMKRNRRSTKKSALVLLSLSISILIASSAQATWVPLTGSPIPISSIPAGGLMVEDKLFSEFELFGMATGGALAPSADSVFVQGGKNSDTDDIGLRFLVSWTAGSGQTISIPSLSYKVSVLPEGEDIKDVSMFLTVASATGTGLVIAGETVLDGPLGNVIASLEVSKQENDGGLNLKDYTEFNLIREIWIRKGISITGGDAANGCASINEFFQFYSQIPEPATVVLLGLGALALIRKRK